MKPPLRKIFVWLLLKIMKQATVYLAFKLLKYTKKLYMHVVVIANQDVFILVAKPDITVHPKSAHILPGQHYQLSCVATGEQPLNYLWYKNGEALLGPNSPILELRLFGEQDVGRYACKVTNQYGDKISEVACLAIGKVFIIIH